MTRRMVPRPVLIPTERGLVYLECKVTLYLYLGCWSVGVLFFAELRHDVPSTTPVTSRPRADGPTHD